MWYFLGGLLIWLVHIFWGGYALSVLWYWFVMPLGAPLIGTLHAAGLSVVVSLFMGRRGLEIQDRRKPDDIFAESLAVSLVLPAMALFLGWLIKLGMST